MRPARSRCAALRAREPSEGRSADWAEPRKVSGLDGRAAKRGTPEVPDPRRGLPTRNSAYLQVECPWEAERRRGERIHEVTVVKDFPKLQVKRQCRISRLKGGGQEVDIFKPLEAEGEERNFRAAGGRPLLQNAREPTQAAGRPERGQEVGRLQGTREEAEASSAACCMDGGRRSLWEKIIPELKASRAQEGFETALRTAIL